MRSLLALVVAVNPLAVAAAVHGAKPPPWRYVATSAIVAGVITITAATTSRPVLELLDVSAPTFRVATGVVLAIASVRWLIVGGTPVAHHAGATDGWRGVSAALGLLPILLTPQLLAVGISVGADDGVPTATLGATAALAATVVAAWARGVPPLVWSATARFVAVAGLAIALALVVDGVKSV